MDPVYFKHSLTFLEANDFLRGLDMRYRPYWEQSRLVADVTARCAGNKDGVQITFPWEREKEPDITEEDIATIRRMARQREAQLNNR